MIVIWEGDFFSFPDQPLQFVQYLYLVSWHPPMPEPENREPDLHSDLKWVTYRESQELLLAPDAALAISRIAEIEYLTKVQSAG